MKAKLYIVSVPIGNYEDITLRALRLLRETGLIICEELKIARKLLSQYEITPNELIPLNEHNEDEESGDVLSRIIKEKNAVLISDAGTPLFSDPGRKLVELCIQNNIDVIPAPGASSIMAALVGSGLNLDNFYYYGWLSPKKDLRRHQLFELKKRKELIILMETPYRLLRIAGDVARIFGSGQKIVIAFDLTLPAEKYYRGTAGSIHKILESKKIKGEFVLLIDNR